MVVEVARLFGETRKNVHAKKSLPADVINVLIQAPVQLSVRVLLVFVTVGHSTLIGIQKFRYVKIGLMELTEMRVDTNGLPRLGDIHLYAEATVEQTVNTRHNSHQFLVKIKY